MMQQQQSSTPPQSPLRSSHQEEEKQNTTSSTSTNHTHASNTVNSNIRNIIMKKDKTKKVRRRVDGSPYTPIDKSRPVKRLVLIRHGQSLGQVSRRKHGWDRQTDVRLRDCPLTHHGQHQAQQLSSRFVAASAFPSSMMKDDEDSNTSSSSWNQIELVLSSPLTRALQTTLLAFGSLAINILVSYEICELGSRIPENIPRDMKSVLGDLNYLLTNGRPVLTTTKTKTKTKKKEKETDDMDIDTGFDNVHDTTFIQRPYGPPTSVETSVLDVATLQPKDWPRDSTPNVVKKDRIKSFLHYLYHDRPESSIAVVCHYNVIRSMVVDSPTSSAPTSGGTGTASTLRPQNAEPIYCYLYHNGDCCLAPSNN
mmetsp:Transcript_20491/g.48670  ORF Transcript_20491/g.48670 Transcript_20491/m.48670 type:complete len:367 (+) Transcript_20491:22-1122(+)